MDMRKTGSCVLILKVRKPKFLGLSSFNWQNSRNVYTETHLKIIALTYFSGLDLLCLFCVFFALILALQSKLYTWVGKMIAVCVIHGGVGPHFFSERLFQQICGVETTPATVDEVGSS